MQTLLEWKSGWVRLERHGAYSGRMEAWASPPHSITVDLALPDRVLKRTGTTESWCVAGAGVISLAGREPTKWSAAEASRESLVIGAAPAFRSRVAGDLGLPDGDLRDDHGKRDWVIWSVATRFRLALNGYAAVCEQECERLMYRAFDRAFVILLGVQQSRRRDDVLDDNCLDQVLEYIELNLGKKVCIGQLASVASLSEFYFLRQFKKTMGLTPHQYILARRMERARLELESGEPIEAVSPRWGFHQMRHFLATYHRHYR